VQYKCGVNYKNKVFTSQLYDSALSTGRVSWWTYVNKLVTFLVQGFSCIEKFGRRPKPFSRTPMTNPERLRQKKVCDGKPPPKKPLNCVHHVHVSEYVLNSMFQVGYS